MLVEGYLVPLSAPDALSGLRLYFEGDLNGTGTWKTTHGPATRLIALRSLWAWLRCGSQQVRANRRVCPWCSVSTSRLGDADEAHLPATPDGAGWLIGNNSD